MTPRSVTTLWTLGGTAVASLVLLVVVGLVAPAAPQACVDGEVRDGRTVVCQPATTVVPTGTTVDGTTSGVRVTESVATTRSDATTAGTTAGVTSAAVPSTGTVAATTSTESP